MFNRKSINAIVTAVQSELYAMYGTECAEIVKSVNKLTNDLKLKTRAELETMELSVQDKTTARAIAFELVRSI